MGVGTPPFPFPNHIHISSWEQDSLELKIILELAFLLGLYHTTPELREGAKLPHLLSQGEVTRQGLHYR